jgi:signal transduction histidine kinase
MGRPRGWTRLYVRNWRVRTKLAAVLLVPSVAFVAVGGLELFTAFRTSQAVDHYADRVALSREVTDLVHQLQRERDRTAGAVVAADRVASESTAIGTVSMATADDRRLVNEAAASYRRAARPVGDRLGRAFRMRVDTAATALDELTGLRTAADEGQLRNDAVFDGYGRLIAALLRVLPDSRVGDDPALEESLRGLSDLVQANELQSQVRGRLQGIAQAGGFTLGEYQELADLRARRTAAVDRFRAEAGPGQLSRYEDQVKGEAVLAADRLERTAADRSRLSALGFKADEWWTASTNQLELLRGAEKQFVDDAVRAAERYAADAGMRARQVAAALAAILLIALVTSLVVGRSMAGSLRRLRRRALVVAQRDLPEAIRRLNTPGHTDADLRIEPVPADSADEIGEVAEAFEAVHQSAVRLATDQAALRRDVSAMFINLARRSQVLVGRQLQLLDELEADEQDPDRLARFFVLDHLATRMRRNDENLLVLAASESHRLWREPVPLYRLLLGAVGETEQYERVEASGPDDVVVPGHVVPDLMHLLAELLDNATTFSPPTTSVQLVARMIRSDAGTEAVITIEDRGMGMTPGMLAEANARLAQPATIDVAVSERMGHFVVSHLAARHGMRVELRGAPGGGVTAAVTLPTALLAPVPDRRPPAGPRSTDPAGAAEPANGSGATDSPDVPDSAPREWTPAVSTETTQPLVLMPPASSTDIPSNGHSASTDPVGNEPWDSPGPGAADTAGSVGNKGAPSADTAWDEPWNAPIAGAGRADPSDAAEPGDERWSPYAASLPTTDVAESPDERQATTPATDEPWNLGAGTTTQSTDSTPQRGITAAGLPGRTPGSNLPSRTTGFPLLDDRGSGAGLPSRTADANRRDQTSDTGPFGNTRGGPPSSTSDTGLPNRPTDAGLFGSTPDGSLPSRVSGSGLPSRISEPGLPSRTTNADLPSRGQDPALPIRPTGVAGSELPRRAGSGTGSAAAGRIDHDAGVTGASGSEARGGWWSGDGSGWRAGITPLPEPTNVETNPAGLPVRVPMAAFPHGPDSPAAADSPTGSGLDSSAPPDPVADPDEVADSLARFHRGIRLADDEDAGSYPN